MEILRDDLSPFAGETVLTIGKFDGLHLGHQELIARIRARAAARGTTAGMVTFDPHPARVLRPEDAPPLLTPLDQKVALLESQGLDLLVLLTFNRSLMRTRAAEFLERLVSALHPHELWVGADFAMGYKREGNVPFIRDWLAARPTELHTIPLLEVDGAPVSGSRIRALLATGDVAAAARLLGRAPSVSGRVVEGDRRGRTIGFPTANLIPPVEHAVPANGVYATQTLLENGTLLPSVTNVGVRPTFDGTVRLVESHLLDWSGALYDQRLTVRFIQRLRGEQRFTGVESLVEQIGKDAARARTVLLERSPMDGREADE